MRLKIHSPKRTQQNRTGYNAIRLESKQSDFTESLWRGARFSPVAHELGLEQFVLVRGKKTGSQAGKILDKQYLQ
jgi:hypothetical protein